MPRWRNARDAKYGNQKTGGYASKKEAKRAVELKLMEKSGDIFGLEEQKRFVLIPKIQHERACTYVADFFYFDKKTSCRVVEDVKGMKTAVYIIKRKLMLHVHGIRVREI